MRFSVRASGPKPCVMIRIEVECQAFSLTIGKQSVLILASSGQKYVGAACERVPGICLGKSAHDKADRRRNGVEPPKTELEDVEMVQFVRKLTSFAVLLTLSATEAFAWASPPVGKGGGGGSAPEIDGPAGLTAIALIACVGLYLYNRYRR